MPLIAFIPGRGGSKGIYKKNMVEIAGKPLIQWTLDAAYASRFIDERQNVIVSTDDAEIEEYVRSRGFSVVRRPDNISGDDSTTEAAIDHYIGEVKGEGDIILLQPTSPIRNAMDVSAAYTTFTRGGYDSLFSCYDPGHQLYWAKAHPSWLPLDHDPDDRLTRQNSRQRYIENGSIYIFKRSLFAKTKCRLGGKVGAYEMPKCRSFQIDTWEDVHECQYLLKR